jgi:hypothetical protein
MDGVLFWQDVKLRSCTPARQIHGLRRITHCTGGGPVRLRRALCGPRGERRVWPWVARYRQGRAGLSRGRQLAAQFFRGFT